MLGSISAEYYQCTRCRLVQVDNPHWLEVAYSSDRIHADVGAVERCLSLRAPVQAIIQQYFDADAQFLDYGGGEGLFVRLMRDRGFDFYWSDKYATNAYAKGFEATSDRSYELVTGFEMFEHLPNPKETVAEMLTLSDSILFSTELLPKSNPRPDEWWYYAPFGGQHITIYSIQSLRILAEMFDCRLATNNKSLHLLTRKRRIGSRTFNLITDPRIASAINRVRRRPSLIRQDFAMLAKRLISGARNG